MNVATIKMKQCTERQRAVAGGRCRAASSTSVLLAPEDDYPLFVSPFFVAHSGKTSCVPAMCLVARKQRQIYPTTPL
jgi:hypothetical protein